MSRNSVPCIAFTQAWADIAKLFDVTTVNHRRTNARSTGSVLFVPPLLLLLRYPIDRLLFHAAFTASLLAYHGKSSDNQS